MKLHPTLTYLLVAVAGSALNAGEQLEKFQPDKRKLTLEETIELALRQNPTILNAKHEIERTRGQVITVRAQALPHLVLTSQYDEEQKSLVQSAATTGGLSSSQASASGSQSGASLPQDKSWYVALQVQQILYSGSVGPAIRAAKLTQDNSIFSLLSIIST